MHERQGISGRFVIWFAIPRRGMDEIRNNEYGRMKNGSYAGRRSIRTGPVGAGTARPVREAAVVPPMRCAAPFPWLCCPDVSLRGAKRRGNLGKALPICTNRRSIRTGPVGAGHAPPVREAAVVPPIRCAAPFPLLRCPDVSLRGPKGAVAISGRHFRFVQGADKNAPTDCVCSGAH